MIERKNFPPYGYADIDTCKSLRWDFIVSLHSPTDEYDELGKEFLAAIKNAGMNQWIFIGKRIVVVGDRREDIQTKMATP